MSNFIAEIQARLNTNGIPNEIKKIESNKINFQNISLDTSKLVSKIQAALNKNRFTINFDKVNISSLTSQMQKSGVTAGKSFSSAFSTQLNNIHLKNGGITDINRMLQGAGFNKSSIASITQELDKMVLTINKISTRQFNNGNIRMTITGIDELNRAVQVVRDFDNVTGQVSNTTKTFIQSFDTGATAAKRFEESAKKLRIALNNGFVESSISGVTAQYDKLSTTGHFKLSQIKKDIEDLNVLQSQLNNPSNNRVLLNDYERFNNILSRVKNNLTTVSAESKTFANGFQINSLDNKVSSWLSKNTKAMSLFGGNINSLQSKLKLLAGSGNATVGQLKSIEQEFNQIKLAATQAGVTGRTFGDTMRKAFSSISRYVSVATIIYRSIQALRDMVKNVYEVDTAMTSLYRVTNLTASQYKSLYADMTNSAKKYGAALSDIIDSTASWVRLGFDSNTANQLAEITTMYQHVTDLDNSTAVNNLVTAYKGFQEQLLDLTNGNEAAAIELVADIYDKLGNEFALSAADVGSGLSKAASTLQLAGNSIQESAAMLTGITEVTQDPDKAGNALKILSLRIRGMKGELEELGEDVDENIESLSKIQTQVLNLTHGKVNIFEDDGSFRSTYEIMQDISSIYDKLSDTEKASLLETIAGKNRANDVAALISNWEQVEKAMQAATNAEGTASAEQAKYMDSMQGRLNTLKATWQSLSNTFIKSDFLKGLISGLTSTLSLLDTLVSKTGAIPTLISTIFAVVAIKNGGFFKTIESEATTSGVRITEVFSNVANQIRTIFSKNSTIKFSNTFSQSLASDEMALFRYSLAIKNGMSEQNAFNSTMRNASPAAQKFAQTMIINGESLAKFTLQQKQSEIALMAQSTSLLNVRSLLNTYNSGLSQLGVSQQQFVQGVSQSNVILARYLGGLNGAKATMGGYIGTLISAKVATISLKVATIALNAAVGMGIGFITSLVTSGIQGLIEAFKVAIDDSDVLREKTEEVTNAFESQKQSLSDTKSKLDSLTSRYETLSRGVDGLNQNVSLSNKEYSEYLDICNQIGDIFPSLIQGYDGQGNAILTLKGNVEGLTQAYNDMAIAMNNDLLFNGKTVFKDFKNRIEILDDKSIFQGSDMTFSTIKQLDKILNSSDLDNAIDKYTQGMFTRIQIVKALKDAGFEEGDDETAHDFIKRAIQENKSIVYSIVEKWNELINESTKNVKSLAQAYIDNSILQDNYSNISSDIKGVLNSLISSFDYDFYNDFKDINDLYNYLETMLDDFNNFSSDDKDTLQLAFNAKTSFNNKECTVGEYLNRISNIEDIISGFDNDIQTQIKLLLDDDDVKNKLNTLIHGKDNDFASWVNGLTNDQLDIAYEISLDENSANYTLDEWKDKIKNYKQPEDLKINFSNLISDDDFSDSVDNYIDKVETLKKAIKELHSGDFDNSSFIDLIKKFPELADNADDLESAIVTLLNSMNDDILQDFASQFGYMKTDEDITALQNFQDAVLELGQVVGNTEFAIDINAEIDSMDTLFAAMRESVSSTGLTAESIKNLQSRYQEFENYDAARLFERTNNGIHLNAKALRELEAEYEKHKKSKFDEQLSTLVDKYNELTNKISNANDAASTGDLYKQRNDILDQINDVADLATQYEGLTSAFHKWEQAQSLGEEGDMYDSLAGSLEDIKKLYEDGLIGTNKFRTAVQLMSNEDLSTASIDELLAAYESGYPVMQKYFTDSSDGCLNFLNDIQNLNSEWAKMNEDGSWKINFGLGNDQEIADALGINVESVQSLMRKLSDYGFDINLDSVYSSFDLLSSKAEKANEKLKELSKTEYTFNFETQDINYINEQITEAQNILNTFKDTNGNINVSIEGADEAQTILISLISNKQALSAPEIMQIDTSTISDADIEISNAIGLLQQFIQYSNDLEIQTALGIDTSETQEKLQTVASNLDAIPDEIKTKLGIDDESFQTAITNLSEKEIDVKAGVNLSEEDIASVQASIDGITAKDIELLTNSSAINEELKGIDEYTINDKTFKVTISNNALIQLQNINSYVIKDKSYTITAKTVTSGFGKAQGSAFATGTWGTKDSGTALGGEIGEEIVVRNGKYFTIGSDGAEFFKYKKGDIIFNAEQSRQIFANGKITNGKKRGVTYAAGNAFAEGTAFSSGSGKITASGKVKTSASNNSSKSESDSSIIDWIEIKLDRIQRKIKELSTIAESPFRIFSKRNNALADEISEVTNEIIIQQRAYNRYIQEAESVSLSYNLAEKVRNGTIDINEYDSDTADKIQEYQKWYESALDCQQAIQDLGETISDLYKQKFDNIVTEWTNKVQNLEHIAERTDSRISRRSDYASEYVTYGKSKWANVSNISDYQDLIKNTQEQIDIKNDELDILKNELNSNVANSSIEWGSEAYYEMLSSIQDVENEIDDLNSNIIDYSNSISEAYKNIFEDIASEYSDKLSLAEHLSNEYNTAIEKAEAMGYVSSSKYYELLRNEEQNQIATLKSEQKDLSDALYSAVASGEIEVGSAAWYEMSQEICNVTEQIQEAELAVIELNNQIRQVQWDNFDYLEDTISKLKDESDFLIDLLSSSNLYEDNGQLTNAGVSTMGLHGVNYNILMSQADDYAAEILSLNKQIASDPANTILIDRRNELLSIQRQCIQAAEDEKAAIKDLVSDGISKELTSLKELIGEYTDALDSQKDLYSFQKKVEKQTQNIATLQKQLSAYQNDITEETKAKIQKIKVELEEAKDDLEETQYEQYISDQKKLLDELYDEYERILNERLDNIDALIEDMIAMVNSSAITINDTLNAATSSVGYTMTTEMSNLWSNAANELAQSRAEQLANVTALINQMIANGVISQENANSILAALGSGSAQEIQNTLNIISKLQENGELDTTNTNSLISALNTYGANYTGVITTYGTDFGNKQTVTNNTLADIKNTVNSILTAANKQAELVKQQIESEKDTITKASSITTKKPSNTDIGKGTTIGGTHTDTKKSTTTQGDGKIQIGDRVTFTSGRYYYDSYGSSPTGNMNQGRTVYITNINERGSKPYHISTGSKLGIGDLGWITKSQLSGYISGAKEINKDELAWTNENYDKIGGETIVRKSDHAVLSTLSKGSRVYNALASDNIWKMANNPGLFIMDNLLKNSSIDTSPISSGSNNDIKQNIDLDINIDNVKDLDDLLNQMKKSKGFEKLIQAIAVAPLTGTSVNKKNRFNF